MTVKVIISSLRAREREALIVTNIAIFLDLITIYDIFNYCETPLFLKLFINVQTGQQNENITITYCKYLNVDIVTS